MGLNRFGYAVAASTALGVALLLVGGRQYAVVAGSLLAVAVVCLAWAMRRAENGRDTRSQARERNDDENDERDRRKKEAKAEKTRFSGEL